jgi:hypothetical protein
MLAHDIGYLKLDFFLDTSVCGSEMRTAMASLNQADVIIFDLRDNAGGVSVSMGRMFQRGRYGLNQGKKEGRLRLALFSCVEITMPKGPFLPSDFTPTKSSTVADKAEFGNILLRFIESEWAPSLFTKSFYNRLSMCFGNIAHYVEGVIMRSACVTTLWIQSSTTSSLCIIPSIEFPLPANLVVGSHPTGMSRFAFQPLDSHFGDLPSSVKTSPRYRRCPLPIREKPRARH